MFIDVTLIIEKIMLDETHSIPIESSVNNFKTCDFPIMVKSNLCNLCGLTPEEQAYNGADVNDNGGYFIIHGSEWHIALQESVKYNSLRLMNRYAPPKDVIIKKSRGKAMIITKFGDGYGLTHALDIHITDINEIYIGINNPFEQGESQIWFPFYVLMYILEAKNDKEIADYVLFNIQDANIKQHIENILAEAFDAPYSKCIFANIKDSKRRLEYLKLVCRNIYKDFTEAEYVHYVKEFVANVVEETILI